MIHEAELTRAIAQNEQALESRRATIAKIARSINEVERQVAKLGEQDQNDIKKTVEMLKENNELRIQLAATKKELMDQTLRSHRLEAELQEHVMKNQNMMEPHRKESEERMIALSSIISYGSTRMVAEDVQKIADMLFFLTPDRTPEEEKAIKKMMADFKKALRPQMDVKDSTQNFYL